MAASITQPKLSAVHRPSNSEPSQSRLTDHIRRRVLPVLAILLLSTASHADSPKAVPATAVTDLPVKEITVFKDGHAFLLHHGRVKTHQGQVHLNYLPSPVIGTFFPYSADPRATLKAARAVKQTLESKRRATTIPELMGANIGKPVMVHEVNERYEAHILDVPSASSASEQPDGNTTPGSLVLLKTETGVRVVPFSRIQEITLLDAPVRDVSQTSEQQMMTLDLNWKDGKPQPDAEVGLTYLQKGIRWIPSYRIELRENGRAQVELQATLLNELIDLEHTKVHLVIGVPSFDFQDTPDPFGLQRQVAELSRYFQTPNQTVNAFSNSIMFNTQVARVSEFRAAAPATSGEPLPGSDVNEELHIFTLDDVSIRRGERIVVPIGRWDVPRSDAFALTLASRPPQEILRQFNNEQQARLAQLMKRPQVDRLAILTNNTDAPFTTAPALFLEAGRLMGQGMMTYTPVGGSVDLLVNKAVDISVAHEEEETSRIPNAQKWGSTTFDRVNLHGIIEITNRRAEPISIRVRRELIGVADQVEFDGKAVRRGLSEWTSSPEPVWWRWYSWPSWWTHLNTRSDVTWNFTLPAGKAQQLGYDWHYYWRP